MRNSFKGGVHPPDCKSLSENKPICEMPAPSVVYIPLVQHLGKPAVPVVSEGDAVKAGTLIARADGPISSNIFSSVSGVVKGIESHQGVTSKVAHIVIENDEKYEETRLEPLVDPTKEQILDRIGEAGIVGLGGAGFPTKVKLNPKNPVDTLIINAAECEPYITCDYRILVEITERFLAGVRLLYQALGLNGAVVAVEDNKPSAIAALLRYHENGYDDIEVVSLPKKYPQGAEKQLIYAVTKRKVPAGGLPGDVGVIVDNVHTALSTYFAVCKGIPLYRRVMTVTGGGITKTANLLVRTGTTFNDIIAFLGGINQQNPPVKMISGGPMMGFALLGGGVSVTKTTSCLLLLSKDEAALDAPSACINCGACARACPMFLMPMFIDRYLIAGDIAAAVKYGAKNCIECGACAYVCPAKRTLVQSIRMAKTEIRNKGL